MNNCTSISAICGICSQLMLEQVVWDGVLLGSKQSSESILSGEELTKLRGWLDLIEGLATDFEWEAVHNRVASMREYLRRCDNRISHKRLSEEYRVMRETIDHGLKWQLVYRYPNRKKDVVFRWASDWAAVIKAFPSAARDIQVAVDLWALQHYDASAYQLMRVLECGLRSLATYVGKTFERQQWHNIIDEIESSIRGLSKNSRANVKQDEIRFLSQAASEFRYFKDGWRNYVAHARTTLTEDSATNLLDHVRTFMTVLSSKVDEHATAYINEGRG